jgi:hypothetical protein
MKATLTIEKRGEGYIYDLFSDQATKRGVKCGLTPLAAATEATKILANLSTSTGAAIVAPPEVLEHIPTHLIGDTDPTNKVKRIKVLEILADLLIAIYGEKAKIPSNVERYAINSPIKALGLIAQRREFPTDSKKVAELMDKIDNPDDFNFARPANLEEQAAFDLRLYKSPYK